MQNQRRTCAHTHLSSLQRAQSGIRSNPSVTAYYLPNTCRQFYRRSMVARIQYHRYIRPRISIRLSFQAEHGKPDEHAALR